MPAIGRLWLALPLMALSLQGCIAAVIPLAAAGAMTSTVRDKPDTPEVETRLSDAAPITTEAQIETETVSETPAVALLPSTRQAIGDAGAGNVNAIRVLEGVSSLPAPSGMPAPLSTPVLADFADYALGIAARDPLKDAIRPSALLARSGVLVPDREPCRFTGNAVLVDLDPGDGLFAVETAQPPTGLAQQLARLRAENVEVVWSTALTADRAGELRQWLKANQLDPKGEDRLLLLRYPDDRKQSRREEAARDTCLIAMLGDERSDFDELFDYLKNPDAAVGLDAMLGKGWFLAPIPSEGQSQ